MFAAGGAGSGTSSKRRRTSMSSSASKDDETGSLDLEYTAGKRKRTLTLDPIEQCQQLYDIVRNQKKEDGSCLCESFIRVPKRRQEPSYYEVVSNPMDMLRIQQKIKMDEYEDVEQMSVDFDLMLQNAKAFYKRSTPEHKDACDLWDLFIESKCRLFDSDDGEGKGKIILKMGKLAQRAAAVTARKPVVAGDDGETSECSSTTTDKDRQEDQGDTFLFNQLEDLFSAIIAAKDLDDRPLHTAFQLLPSRKKYPSYYEIIDNPIDLKMIATKIQQGEYISLAEMEKDLMQICRNACTFNEPGSQIYKYAKTLKKVISSKKYEIEHGRPGASSSTPGKSERIRNRKLRSGISHSAATAALQYEDDEEEEEDAEEVEGESEDEERVEDEEEEDEEEENAKGNIEDPMWALYEHVSTYTTSTNVRLADPFHRLPSRRFYPDYYSEIKNPVSLAQIKSRILRNEYVNLTQVQADMNVMFENAKAYNMPESLLYKTAAKLQKIVQNKVQELLGPDGDESSNDDIVVTKRSINNTPILNLKMEVDLDDDDEGIANTSGSNRTPGSGKRGFKAKIIGQVIASQVVATTVPPSKSSPTKVEEKNIKNLAYREQLRKRFQALYQVIADYTESDGRSLISIFMEKPSRKLYPDYYQVISDPIDMITIKANIEQEKYNSSEEVMNDFTLMFNNCRLYNEEGSSIYEDANRLEKMLKDKMRFMGADPMKPKLKKKKNPLMLLKQKKLLETVREYRDKNGRVLASIFQKLPSKAEYPEYYEIIKSPIDLEKIGNKQRNGTYETLEQLFSDLMLMFDNGCKFNEPDSIIYKDALILQRLVLQTKTSICAEEDGIPDVQGAVKEILISIFTSVYNHQDEEGRCFTDTMAELPEYDEVEGIKVRALSLDLIKSRLDRGYYKRLNVFQRDMFLCFDRARKLSRTDSQVFEDSVELQAFFLKARDEMCCSGEVLKSPALNYKVTDLELSVEAMRQEKKTQEVPQEEDVVNVEKKDEAVESQGTSQSESYNEQTYCIGDFVYVNASPGSLPTESGATAKTSQPNIANIQKLWTDPDGTKWFEGIWFFRPDQTFHIPTRKFLQKEVFRSEVRTTAMLSEIVGKCWVMTVKGKEYFTHAPEGYSDDDVYVCEYRYSSKARSYTKLKYWAFDSERVSLIPRPKPLEPIRVASVFKERVDKHKEELQQIEDDMEKMPPEMYPNIELPPIAGKEGCRYFEQFSLSCGPIRTGDFVYVRVENAKKLVARVDSMWADINGTTFFYGPWFTSLSEISPSSVPPGRVFYKQEIFQSSIEDTNPLLSICGKCCVLDLDEYIKMRPTEISEVDTFVCESFYDEARRQIKKFDGLKKYTFMDQRVHQDETYFFRKPITVVKVDLEGTVLPEMPRLKAAMKTETTTTYGIKLEMDSFMDDSLESPPSIGSNSETTGSVIGIPIGPMTPLGTTKKHSGKTGKKLVTGYILYSSEVRRGITEKNPTSSFGEISRMVGQEWKKMTRGEKQKFEERAAKMNEEKEAAIAAGIDPGTIGPGSQRYKENASKQEGDLAAAVALMKKDPDWIFECCWDGCEWQFEDALDLIEHCVQEPKGHCPGSFVNIGKDGEFQCKWTNCGRIKKGSNPFPTLNRLLKHVREIHILKGNGRIIHPEMRSKLFRASRNPKPRPVAAVIKTPGMTQGQMQPTSIVVNSGMPQSNVLLPSSSPTLSSIVGASGVGQMTQMQPQVIVRSAPPPEPLFVTVPPRPQKLLHSEAYIRYIESLHISKKSDWDKTLHAKKENVKVEEDKLPSQWLGNGAGAHTSVTDALWALRDFMMRDCLNLSKTVNFKNY